MVWGQYLLCIFSCFWRVYFAKSIVVLVSIAYTLTISLFLSKGIYVFVYCRYLDFFCLLAYLSRRAWALFYCSPRRKWKRNTFGGIILLMGEVLAWGDMKDRPSWQRMQVSPSSLLLLKSCYRLCILGQIWGGA